VLEAAASVVVRLSRVKLTARFPEKVVVQGATPKAKDAPNCRLKTYDGWSSIETVKGAAASDTVKSPLTASSTLA
jgi:hypothetical protein